VFDHSRVLRGALDFTRLIGAARRSGGLRRQRNRCSSPACFIGRSKKLCALNGGSQSWFRGERMASDRYTAAGRIVQTIASCPLQQLPPNVAMLSSRRLAATSSDCGDRIIPSNLGMIGGARHRHKKHEFALNSAAVAFGLADGSVNEARIALGSAATNPERARPRMR
jgi:hypothetical protein